MSLNEIIYKFLIKCNVISPPCHKRSMSLYTLYMIVLTFEQTEYFFVLFPALYMTNTIVIRIGHITSPTSLS